MNKGFKVLSSVLAMSMVLASGVFAEDEPSYVFPLDAQKALGLTLPTETKEVKKEVVYKELFDDAFKKSLDDFEEAIKKLNKDVDVIAALGDARCQAQFALDSANNQILATNKLIELAEGIDTVGITKEEQQKLIKIGDNGEVTALNGVYNKNLFKALLFKADAEKSASLKKANLELAESYANAIKNPEPTKEELAAAKDKADKVVDQNELKRGYKLATGSDADYNNDDNHNKPAKEALTKDYASPVALARVKTAWLDGKDTLYAQLLPGYNTGKSNKEKLAANIKALNDLKDKVTKDGYNKAVTVLKDNYAHNDKTNETAQQVADRTVSKLRVTASKAAAKINLVNELAKRYKVTLRACSLADYTGKVSGKAETAEDKKNAKKDDVPNTASYFMVYVPTCQVSAPAVKYYGAAQVYDKVLRRPLVCKKVKEEIVKVPMFTFDELTAYDVACCCCK